MDKTVNQKAWFLVLPVFLVVAFSAILPLMTVVNYSMQDTFGNNQFFWNGVGWLRNCSIRRPISADGSSTRWVATCFSRRSFSRSRCPWGSSSRCRCRARAGRSPPVS